MTRTANVPSKQTLKKYGLSEQDWRQLLQQQNGVCYVCNKLPTSGRLHIDHAHVPRWKDMPPEKRKLYVRGLLCWFCNNNYVGRAITIRKAQNVVSYLRAFDQRLKEQMDGLLRPRTSDV